MTNNNNVVQFLKENGFNETKSDDINEIFLDSITQNDVTKTKILIDFANKNNIILNINEKNVTGCYPLYWSVFKNNIKMTKLLIDYANHTSTILNLYESSD